MNKMLDPFTDTTQRELREAWKRIEELEKENKELQEQLEKERELYYGDDDDDDDWGRE